MKLVSQRQKNSFKRLFLFLFLSFSILGVASFLSAPNHILKVYAPVNDSPDSNFTKKRPKVDTLFKSTLRNADNLFTQKKYDLALTEYEKAQKLVPNDPVIKERISKIKSLMADQKKAIEDYQKTIVSADNYFNAKDYLNAKAAYQLAINLKPEDQYAKDKLKETMEFLRSQKATNILYDVAIESAEQLFRAKEYEKARIEYEKASKVLPTDVYAKDRINECIKIMIDQQTREEMYAKSIASADKFYGAHNFQGALLDYKDASSIKPEEKYPKDRIAELTVLLKAQKEKDDAYNKAIANGDKLFKETSWLNSRAEYQNASKIEPEQVYPKNRIKEIDDLLAHQSMTENEYQRLISVADSFYIEKNFIRAKANYQQALAVKPGESYPKEMIGKADNLLAGQEANAKSIDEAYKSAIANADKLFTDKSYDRAKSEYQNALNIKPSEQYPKDKIAAIESIFASAEKQKVLQEKYQSAITNADKLFADKSYEQAKTGYQDALSLMPSEEYPKNKIGEIDKIIGEKEKLKALETQYNDLIANGDKLLSGQHYEQAKIQYSQALQIKPEEQYPKNKLTEIDKALGDLAVLKALDDQYQASITKADKLFNEKTYEAARSEYTIAGNLKPKEQYPKDKIAEIDKTLAALADMMAKDDQYKASIGKADKLLADKSYEQAKNEYQNAGSIKPDEQYPKQKIAGIDKILEEIALQKSLEDQYKSTIANADKLLSDKSYGEAKVQYQSALKLKPAEKYPVDKIAEIDLALADIAKQKSLDDQYLNIIKTADNLLATKVYDQARAKYSDAGNLKPSEQYPKDKIAEIDKILEGIAQQKALDEKYQNIIANADKLLVAKSYDQSRAEYMNASSLKPAEQYPKDKITEIDKIFASIADQKAKDDQYKASIDKADKLLANKTFDQARSEYQSAGTIKPAEQYPKQKISEIDNILADIAKQKALDDQYAGTIANADKLLEEKSYDQAKTQYQAALTLKPTEKYPKDKITEIDLALAEIAKQKALDDQFRSSIDKADRLLAEKSYEPAKVEYTNASKIKPSEQYPKDKIAEIDKTLAEIAANKAIDEKYKSILVNADKLMVAKTYDQAKTEYTNAVNLKPSEQYPKDKIAEIEKILADIAHQKEIGEQYRTSVLKADQLFSSKSYDQAKTEYINAGMLKPNEQYPKTKIAEIEKLFADLRALDEQYNASIAKADKLLGDKSYDLAKTEYLSAGRMKPGEQYPKDKIAEIDKTLAELAKQKAIEDQYKSIITQADKLFEEKSYEHAKTEYTNAGAVKPTKQYPKDKINEIETLFAELKARDESYKASIVKADQLLLKKSYDEAKTEYQNAIAIKPSESYPKDKIAEINKTLTELLGKKKLFDDLVQKGDELYARKDLYQAKDQYQQSLTIFPDEAYPKQRISRINVSIDSLYRANKGFYDKAVGEGDKYYNTFIFDKAIDAYSDALSFLPMESYPKEMINKIKKIIAENAIVDVIKTSFVTPGGTEKQFSFTPVNMASRKNNYFYVKIKNLSDKPFNVLLRYGKDKQTNGGAVIKNLAADGKINDRLISVRDQDPWYREDNNWISVYPQIGDVEITFIQISRAQ